MRTLWAWSDRLEVQRPAAHGVFAAQGGAAQGVTVLGTYRLDVAGSALDFGRGGMAVHHRLALRPDGDTTSGTLHGAQSDYPFTRDSMYKENTVT